MARCFRPFPYHTFAVSVIFAVFLLITIWHIDSGWCIDGINPDKRVVLVVPRRHALRDTIISACSYPFSPNDIDILYEEDGIDTVIDRVQRMASKSSAPLHVIGPVSSSAGWELCQKLSVPGRGVKNATFYPLLLSAEECYTDSVKGVYFPLYAMAQKLVDELMQTGRGKALVIEEEGKVGSILAGMLSEILSKQGIEYRIVGCSLSSIDECESSFSDEEFGFQHMIVAGTCGFLKEIISTVASQEAGAPEIGWIQIDGDLTDLRKLKAGRGISVLVVSACKDGNCGNDSHHFFRSLCERTWRDGKLFDMNRFHIFFP